jgi:hypothetical protein
MRTFIRLAAVALLLAAPLAHAHSRSHSCEGVSIGDLDSPARWAPRRDSRLAHWHTTSRDGKVALLLTRGTVTFQLSDAAMRDVERELDDARDDDEDNPFGAAIKSAVAAGVRVLLKHSAEVPVAALESVEYRNGELIFVTVDGERLFQGFNIDDQPLTRSFNELDARAFVREFHRVKGQRRV